MAELLDLAFNPILDDGKVTGVSVFGKDITERKAAEKALREAEKKYRDIFDGALEGMFQTTHEGRSLTANPALAEMLGYDSPEEFLSMVSKTAHDVWADPNERAKYLREVEEHGDVLGFESQFKRKDGSNIWVSLNARRVLGADGQLLYLEGFMQDITERKETETALRESLDTLQEAQIIGILGNYALDVSSGEWTSSPVMDEIFGIDRQYKRSVEGWLALIHPEDRAMMTAYLAGEVLGKGRPFDKEYRIVRQADGAERWVHGRGRLEFNAHGQPLKMRGIIQDITERKLSEIQLRDSEERYRATFEQAAVGIVHTSFEGTVLRCNPRFAEIVGYPPEEIPGMTVQQLTAPEDIAESIEVLQQQPGRAARTARLEKRFVRKDGSLTWAKLAISIQRDGEGRALHFMTFVEDIDASKAAQELLATAQEAVWASEERYRTVFQTSPDLSISTVWTMGHISMPMTHTSISWGSSAKKSLGERRGNSTSGQILAIGRILSRRCARTPIAGISRPGLEGRTARYSRGSYRHRPLRLTALPASYPSRGMSPRSKRRKNGWPRPRRRCKPTRNATAPSSRPVSIASRSAI